MRCSCSRIRADSVSTVSASSTGTAACMTMGPASSSGVTKCTVAPVTFTPCSSAWRWASVPGNAGSSDGWMLRIAFGNASQNPGPSRRMKPARQTRREVVRLERRDERGVVRRRGTRTRRCGRHDRRNAARSRVFEARRVGAVRRSRPRCAPADARDRSPRPVAARLLPRPEIITPRWGTGLFSTAIPQSGDRSQISLNTGRIRHRPC